MSETITQPETAPRRNRVAAFIKKVFRSKHARNAAAVAPLSAESVKLPEPTPQETETPKVEAAEPTPQLPTRSRPATLNQEFSYADTKETREVPQAAEAPAVPEQDNAVPLLAKRERPETLSKDFNYKGDNTEYAVPDQQPAVPEVPTQVLENSSLEMPGSVAETAARLEEPKYDALNDPNHVVTGESTPIHDELKQELSETPMFAQLKTEMMSQPAPDPESEQQPKPGA